MTEPWFKDVLLHSRAYIVSQPLYFSDLSTSWDTFGWGQGNIPRSPAQRAQTSLYPLFQNRQVYIFFSQNPKRPSSVINSKYCLFPLYMRVFHLWTRPNTASSTEVQRPKKKAHEISNFSPFHRGREAWVGRNTWKSEEYEAFWNQQ